MTGYLLLFVASFLAATIVPFSSEAILYGLLKQGEPSWNLIIVATCGNTLGAAVNWVLGRYLLHYKDRRWFYFSEDQLTRMQMRFRKYGVWSLLFSWLPLGGDILTCVAGVMRVPFMVFLPLVAIGKGLRYIVVFYLSLIPLT
ncbi:YqaA family protein [Desulfopila aestuarii]|uniref:Membrane protein YqaA, SNARE-associated domain n=1 Tax=Desulfopila aestuarii DSM 18488 TaxID=1121416 RepID=A0A1M7Y933_9BACT|nr:YqaA family protein [Desulfopila aestuarii]SHO49066.1 membrane protein YqaA, SNARE-associated domain [Desulfopila aestuarii DSM 18488]